MENIVFSPDLTIADNVVLENLSGEIETGLLGANLESIKARRDSRDISALQSFNDPKSQFFDPTVLSTYDLRHLRRTLPVVVDKNVVAPYIASARRIVRHETDVVMATHLILYFSTSVPSAIWLFYNFTYLHGVLHFLMQAWYTGSYTLMRHQHIHQNGVLTKDSSLVRLFDMYFPYVTDPLMGHTWNSYYYHHVKHHHVEGNGPDDLSSTLRYQRDDLFHFLHYLGRFFFFVWLDLPLYFFRKGQTVNGARILFWELFNYFSLFILYQLHSKATTFVFLLPLLLMRLGLMVGNWGQHAFVDPDEPDSDFRSSITLIDVASNRYCFNDGYHTSHHLNPRRHWREHPIAFLQQKRKYAEEKALVFHNIDYLMITVKLLQKDYDHLARCLVPIGQEQIELSMKDRAEMLRGLTRRFTEEEIREKFPRAGQKQKEL
ncbi:uncharacterized protein QC763_501910 [Podospora pseudopauciseta]|uniref:Fatty acid desaturase domain-containing protein n=1 Tax=Podospora pseudopauciseta TaxID=2093780 RepID=A0ABR0H748_9PEZI|nr:hypothetical protein QC763_501910 [Podospora pseudopauciseta]